MGAVLGYKGREGKQVKLAFIYTYLPTYLPYTKAAVALPTTLRAEVEVSTLGDDAWGEE